MPSLAEPLAIAPARPWPFTPPKWETPERSLWLVAIIVAMTTLAAIAMLPNTEEKAQVMLSQGRVDDAIALYEDKRHAAPLNPFEAYSLALLYVDTERTRALSGLLEDEIARRPGSDWARTMLIAHYRAHRDRPNEARVLFQAFTREATEENFRRLIGLYRLLGNRAGERATLEWARTENLASPSDLDRLTHLNSSQADAGPSVLWRSSARTL